MDEHGKDVTSQQGRDGGQSVHPGGGGGGTAAGQGTLDGLLSQLEIRWGKMAELIVKLREENSFLQEQLRDREEKTGQLEAKCHEAEHRVDSLNSEKDRLVERMESLLVQMKHFENAP